MAAFKQKLCLYLAFLAIVNGVLSQKDNEEDDGPFICPLPSGSFANPKTCRKFFQCVDGYAYENKCPAGLHFDDVGKFCTFKNEARCGPVPTTVAPVTEAPADLALKCDTSDCALPQCFCSKDGTRIPGSLEPTKTPQMIVMTFDGAVNINNIEKYNRVFLGNRTNPNGCPIRGTFFISHEYANYQMIQRLHHEGHEIAVETISTTKGLERENYDTWVNEMVGMKDILARFANITGEDIIGMRAPYLKPGYNKQYEVLQDFGFVWDSTVGVPPLSVPVWPYTLDYKIPHECKAGTCPTRSFQGIWELPLNSHYVDSFEGGHCPYLDQCVLFNHSPENVKYPMKVLEWLQEDFRRHYEQNRAPYMMPFHTTWFQQKELEEGLLLFLDWVLEQKDVWFVTATQSLLWVTEPVSTDALGSFEAWDCKKRVVPEPACSLPNKCPLTFKNLDLPATTRYMTTCFDCPNRYPWTKDTNGDGIEDEQLRRRRK